MQRLLVSAGNEQGEREQVVPSENELIARAEPQSLVERCHSLVIARNSSFVYKGKAVDVRQVGRELGVRYVLEGGVRKAGNRVRITVQLLEAETGAHLWADKFDGALEDVFELQDQITDRVVGIVEPSLRQSEIEHSRRKRPENLDAYDLYLRALPHMTSVMPADARIAWTCPGFVDR